MICPTCGETLEVGQWPFCPHARVAKLEYHEDAIPGGMLVENGVPEPTVVYSHSELRRLRDQHGWQVKETWTPMPGTDTDPQGVPNPMGYLDPVTFENGKALILRAAGMDRRRAPHHAPSDADLGVDTILKMTDDRVVSHAEMQALLEGRG